MTVHPQTGKKEYIFVDLAAVYPAPEEPGSELSFEEIMATRRGWLDQSWDHETVDENLVPEPMGELNGIEEISHGVKGKLVIHRDSVLLDENGDMREQPREPRIAKKKKVMEVNETQISKAPIKPCNFQCLISSSQGKVGLSLGSKTAQEADFRANNDASYQGSDRRYL